MLPHSNPATTAAPSAGGSGSGNGGGAPNYSAPQLSRWSQGGASLSLNASSDVSSSEESSSVNGSSSRTSSLNAVNDDEHHRTRGRAGGVSGAHSTAATSVDAPKSRSTRAKRWLKKNLIPNFVHEYGRTVYGGNPLTQQTLPGIFNYPSPFILVPLFYLLMLPFLILGGMVLVRGRQEHIIEQEYSQIHQYQYTPSNSSVNINHGILQFMADGVTHTQGTRTWLEINISQRMEAPVYMYYKITGMYQNHRDFHNGRSNSQLRGKPTIGTPYLCMPYTHPGFRTDKGDTPITITDATGTQVTRPARYFTYNPCGIAPWSMFNDTFILYRKLTPAEVLEANISGVPVLHGGVDGMTPVELVCNGTDFGLRGEPLNGSVTKNNCAKKGISWKADRDIRFHNITLREDWWSLYYPHPTTNEYLRNGWYLHEPGHALPDPSDYDLHVWLRASFTSNFRKLYRIIHVPIDPGTYLVDITELYDVVSFYGRKSVVLQHTNWVGGRNVLLGVVFIIMGCLSFVLGVTFTVECMLQLNGVNRYKRLREPKRSWYVFQPDEPEFANYYQLRLRRHIPMAQLQLLRRTVSELEHLANDSKDDANSQRT